MLSKNAVTTRLRSIAASPELLLPKLSPTPTRSVSVESIGRKRVSRAIIAFVPIFLVIASAEGCWAQARLSLQEAVHRALQSRASLKAEAERWTVAEGLKKQAGLFPNPEFQFQNENLRPGQTYGRDVDTLAMINQPLDVLGKRRQRIALAGDGVSRTQAEYELTRWQIAQSVKLAYWAARGAQEVREVLKSTVENFQKIIDYHAAQ